MPVTPLISVVIATFNRCDILKVTLEKLAAQSIPAADFEIIVVDDGSTDDTQRMVKSFVFSVPYQLRYFRHENQGPGYTQNRGIKETRSNLVLLTADDIWATPELLEQHLKSHVEYTQENIAVLGKVMQSPQLPTTVMHKHWEPFRYGLFKGKSELDGIRFLACNISTKKSFLIRNGMYKERRAVAHEDIELGYRLREKGLRIIYNERALGHHYHPETLTDACRRAYERGLNFDMLTENIPKSFIFPLYHICTLEAGMKNFLRMLPREIFRSILFNKWTVNNFWVPMLRRAETSRFASLFANQISYRGTVHYHQRLGLKQLRKRNNKPQSLRVPLTRVIEEG